MNQNNDLIIHPLQEEVQQRQQQLQQQENFGLRRLELEKVRRNDPTFLTLSIFDPRTSDQVDTDLHRSLGYALMGNTHLRRLDLEEVVLQESAETVARGIGQATLTCLCLKNVSIVPSKRQQSLGDEQEGSVVDFWRTLYQGLQSSQKVETLRIWNTRRMDGMVALGDALPKLHSLRELHLNLRTMDEVSAQAFANGLRQSNIKSLDLVNRMLFGQGDENQRVWQMLGKSLQTMPSLEELHLRHVSLIQATTLREALPLMQPLRKLILQQLDFTEPVAEALAEGISQSNVQTLTILFPDRNSNAQRWQVLFRGLQASKALQELESPSVPVEAVSDLAGVISKVPSLRKLVLHDITVLTAAAAKTLAASISGSKLECLKLCQPFRDESEQYQEVQQILYQGLQTMQTLQELAMSWIPLLQEDGLIRGGLLQSLQTLRVHYFDVHQYGALFRHALVQSNTALTTLALSHGVFRAGIGQDLLVQGLRANSSITSLELSDCSTHNDRRGGVEALLELDGILLDHVSLTKLTMQRCGFGDASIRLLVEHWPAHSPIQSLSLADNVIEATGVELLIRAIRDRRALQQLDLSSNPIGYGGLRIMAEELVHNATHLTHVMLGFCLTWTYYEDPNSDLAQAQERARSKAGEALLESVVQNHRLRHLSVVGNGFHPKLESEIGFYSTLNRTGRFLLSSHHGLPSAIWCHVFAKCQDLKAFGASIIFYYLQQQPNLVQSSPQH